MPLAILEESIIPEDGLQICTLYGTFMDELKSMDKETLKTKKLVARFYKNASGKEPVRDWLRELNREDRKRVGVAIKDTEFSWPIGLPLCGQIKGHKGLWEVRCDISDGRIVRVMFIMVGKEMILLDAFIKKSQKTEQKDINRAVKRKKEFESYG